MDELFYSPLGVLVLARSIIEVSGVPSAMLWGENLGWYPAEDLASCLQALSLRVPSKGYFDQLSAERLSELIVQGEFFLTPFNERYQRQADILLASGLALKPFAAHFLAAPGTATWFTDLDRKRQEWVSSIGLPPQVSSFHPDLCAYGAGNTKPRQTFWTSTSLTARTSSWLHYLRWGEDRRDPPYPRWHVEVLPSARVYEIHGPQAWQNLCLASPAPSRMAYSTSRPDTLIEPDWQAVSQDWDGVHLSIGGLLTTERVRWGTPGRQTHLFGWSVESTAWLRWVFSSVERLPDVS
ncbi:MAG TPA: hypothetical protein VEL31_19335 [Ktedonobacteraceae bacterium]|nr:hypothetical protein [Ktedonobacteraceae bacterium]